MVRWLVALAVVGAGVCASPSADACSVTTGLQYVVEPNPEDTEPPKQPMVLNVEVHVNESSGFCEVDSCDGLHSLQITLRTTDDVTPSQAMGFEIELVGGSLPGRLQLPSFPVQLYSEERLSLPWYDDDSYDFDLRLTPVDKAGNVGPPVTVNVSRGSGCSVGGTANSWFLIAFAVLLTRGRRR